MSTVTVCITSPQPNNDRLAQLLQERGIGVWQLPLLEFDAPSDHFAALDLAIQELPLYQFVVLTSPRAVSVFQDRLSHNGNAALGHLRFAVVGESTARACAENGFPVHLIPQTATSQALGELMAIQAQPGSRILFPQAEEGRDEFVTAMSSTQASVTVVPTYRTVPARIDVDYWRQRMQSEEWKGLVVTSPKALRVWMDLFGHPWCHEMMRDRTLFLMGPTSQGAAENLGFRHVKIPPHATLESLADYFFSSGG